MERKPPAPGTTEVAVVMAMAQAVFKGAVVASVVAVETKEHALDAVATEAASASTSPVPAFETEFLKPSLSLNTGPAAGVGEGISV